MSEFSISLAHSPIVERAGLAAMADEAGVGTIWTEDGDAFVAAALIAANVKRARVGTGIARAFTRSPMVTATSAANLHNVTNGRFVLGLGSGTKYQNLAQVGETFDHPATRMADLCAALRTTWNAEGADTRVSSRFISMQLDGTAAHRSRCMGGQPPIYFAAVNNYMLRMAGRVADGLAGHPVFSVPYIRDVARPRIAEGLADANRSGEDFRLAAWVITSIDEDRELARRRAAYQIAFYFSTKSYREMLEWHGFTGIQDRIREALFKESDWEKAADCLPREMVDMFSVAGTADECREQLRRYSEVADEVVLYSYGAGPVESQTAANLRRIIRELGAVVAGRA